MSFTEAFPELMAQAPHIHGTPLPARTVLNRLSRQQLTDLARAYEVSIPQNGTKDEILPAMINAEQAGIFKGPVKSQYHLLKASRDRDKRPEPLALPDPDLVKTAPTNLPASQMSIQELRKRLKDAGISSFQMKREQMEEIVEAGSQ